MGAERLRYGTALFLGHCAKLAQHAARRMRTWIPVVVLQFNILGEVKVSRQIHVCDDMNNQSSAAWLTTH